MARKTLTPSKKEARGFDRAAKEIVFESEFLALAVEHPHTTNEIKGVVNLLMMGALDKIRDYLTKQNADGHMVRDILPHAIYVHTDFMNAFKFILDEMPKSKGGARVLDSIQKHADRDEVPPRYAHPAKEYMQRWRGRWMMAGSTVPELPPSDPEEETAKRIADLIEAEWGPPVVRDILRQVCELIDCAAVVCDCDGDCTLNCLVFLGDPDNVTPRAVRRELPAMLRKVGHYRADFSVDGVDLREPEGGA